MPKVITVQMDPNEQGSERHMALVEVLAKHPERWDFQIENIPLDLVFSLAGWQIAWELKEPSDFVSSLMSGHLACQRMQARDMCCPASVGVLGTFEDVLESVSEITKSGWKNPREMAQAEAAIERSEASLWASGFRVDYLGMDHERAMRMITRRSYAALHNECKLPLPKAEDWQTYALCGLPGIGGQRAQAMQDAGCKLYLFYGANVAIPAELESIPGIGKKTAEKILGAMR